MQIERRTGRFAVVALIGAAGLTACGGRRRAVRRRRAGGGRALRRGRARRLRGIAGLGDGAGRGDRRVRRRPDRRDAGGGQAGVADGPRRLRADRGVPLLRRPDRRRGDRARRARSTPGRSTRRTSTTSRATTTAGIVNDTAGYPTIDAELIASLNEQGGETNISTGWHAIEFLLWGQDLSADGPGARPVTDYTDGAERRPARRRTSRSPTDLLRRRPRPSMVEAWAPDADNYRAEFVEQDADEALADDHHRHRRADPRRAGRRADERRLRGAVAGGRALVLLRQHDRRPRSANELGIRDGGHRRVPGRSTGPA